MMMKTNRSKSHKPCRCDIDQSKADANTLGIDMTSNGRRDPTAHGKASNCMMRIHRKSPRILAGRKAPRTVSDSSRQRA
nr:hypothetical protein Hi04_10k_c5016_00033 [uncultured bacterium]